MGCMDELKSGKFAIYAQWGGLASSIICVLVGISCLTSSTIIFAVASIAIGCLLFLLEVTWVAKCIRGTDRIIELSKNNKMKLGLYSISSVVIWLSLLVAVSTLILPALVLTFTTGCYLGAVMRNEDPAKSGVLSQEGITRSVISRV
ncbi:Golgi apparatus membrane protein tvp18 [Kappamyces sp. JEL0829]|nr:Golgi apparatus membrane protein tvp18 [Kappamyces sp. JEL0829]